MKHLRLLLLSMMPLLLVACASNQGTSPQQAAAQRSSGSFQPASGTDGLYIFKEGAVISVVDSQQVSLDGRALGLVAAGAYLYAPLTPGPHTVSSGTSHLSINAVVGQNNFVQQTPNLDASGQILSSTIQTVSAESGVPEIKKMQLANFGH